MIKAAIHGFGNIGKYALGALLRADDMECTGVIRRQESLGKNAIELRGIQDYASIEKLIAVQGTPDVILVCAPSRSVPEQVTAYLQQGLRTVDSFDIHGDIPAVVESLGQTAIAHATACVTAAGWDPGTDSILRALFEAMVPVGTTFTNFGRGRSMGHSVAARAINGVADATSITIPTGGGRHARLVYLLMKEGASFDTAKAALAADPYFKNDTLDVRQVISAEALAGVADNSHGVRMERTGASGDASNQQLVFDMRIDNPALTAQVLVSCARAVTRLSPGSYTLIDIPPVALLPGERLHNIGRLV